MADVDVGAVVVTGAVGDTRRRAIGNAVASVNVDESRPASMSAWPRKKCPGPKLASSAITSSNAAAASASGSAGGPIRTRASRWWSAHATASAVRDSRASMAGSTTSERSGMAA